MLGNRLELTRSILCTMAAVHGMTGDEQLGRGPGQPQCSWASRLNDHPFTDAFCAGRDRFGRSLDLNEANAASCQRLLLLPDGAQVWNVDAIVQGGPEDGLAFGSFNPLAVDG